MKGKNPNPGEETFGHWSRIKSLFGGALDIDPATRASWLKEQCRDRPTLAREVESLLKHHDSDDKFLETPAWRFDDQSSPNDTEEEEFGIRPGAQIGSWQILGEIRSGGMGTVYLAERTIDDEDQPTRQRAAIKIIRARINAQLFARRFRRERRILARLNQASLKDGLAKAEDTLDLLTEAIRYGERAYQANPSDRDALDSLA